MKQLTGGQLLVQCLEAQGVEYIFGIPGAKVDRIFDALLDSPIKLVVCRHEQNATFMAGAYGRLTGKPGVVLVTSGPGVTNMATGLLTATTEGDPIVAIGGNVSRAMLLKQSHQRSNNVELMAAVTKRSVEIMWVDSIPEVINNAFRTALEPQAGASFISVPQDILNEQTTQLPIQTMAHLSPSQAPLAVIDYAANLINQAKQPLFLLGLEASRPNNTQAIRALLKHKPFAVISTYQAAGVISRELLDCFIGRVGLFKNQPGDAFLDHADVVITIGFNPVEYDPELWNSKNNKQIIHLNYTSSHIACDYHPVCEVLGDIALNIEAMSASLQKRSLTQDAYTHLNKERQALLDKIESGKHFTQSPIHPLRFIYELQQVIDDNTTICCDIGTHYMWMARYFLSYLPHQLLFSNGQQTLGVALPWAIATHYARPGKPVISISGDGGFLFSATELETAVREHVHLIHFIWRDGSYNMVLEQQLMKYHRKSGVDLGRVHIPEFAKAFGALGLELNDPAQFKTIFAQALDAKGPVLIDVPIDYSDNEQLFKLIAHEGH